MRSAYRFLVSLLYGHKAILILMCAFFLGGASFAFINRAEWKLRSFMEFVDQMEAVAAISPSVFLSIFLNNLRAVGMMQLFGFLIILPSIVIFTNGYILGLFTDLAIRSVAISSSYTIVRVMITSVVPHAVIEIPTFILAGFTATLLGMKVYFPSRVLPGMSRIRYLRNFIVAFLIILVPLFAAAAWIEAYITPVITRTIEEQFTGNDTKTVLQSDVLLNADDISRVGGTAVPADTFAMPGELQWMIRLSGVFVFDDEVYRLLRQSHGTGTGVFHFRLPEDAMIWGYVMQFANYEDSLRYNEAYRKSLQTLAEIETGSMLVSHGQSWTFKRGDKTYYGTSQTAGTTGFVIWYIGADPDILTSVSVIQSGKLREQ